MIADKPVVLIGPVSNDPADSVSLVNRTLANGLRDQVTFVESSCNRRFGTTRQSRINCWNLFYLVKHSLIWISNLLRFRPQVAHYAISSGPAMEKGLLLLAAARILGAATVAHLHSGGFVDHWRNLNPTRRRFAAWQLAKLDGFIVLSAGWRDLIASHVRIDRSKLHIVNNPIEPEFEREALAMPVVRPQIRILSLGTMGTDKGVLELAEATAMLGGRNLPFMLDLAGPEREPGIRKRVADHLELHHMDSQVRLHGCVQGLEKTGLFRDASIFVLPSHYENFPLVILEAAAAGHAIITTPVGAIPEFFEDGVSAMFVEIGNPRQLAAAMTRLIEDSRTRRRLAESARRVFLERLSRVGISNSLLAVYEDILPVRLSSIASANPSNP